MAKRVVKRRKPAVRDGALKKGQSSFVFSLADLPCEGCRQGMAKMLRKYHGVAHVHMSSPHNMCVHYTRRKTSPGVIMSRATNSSIPCLYEKGGKGSKRAQQVPTRTAPRWPKGLDMKIISKRGELVSLKRHVVRGKVTIFDFYADWCDPCKDLDRWMIRLMRKNKRVVVRKINIVDWRRPMAKRYLKRSSGLPFLMIYNRKGKRSSTLSGFSPDELRAAIAKAR